MVKMALNASAAAMARMASPCCFGRDLLPGALRADRLEHGRCVRNHLYPAVILRGARGQIDTVELLDDMFDLVGDQLDRYRRAR